MRVDDLRDGLRAAADEEPTADVMAGRAGVARLHRRHQTIRGALAAACVVVLALAGWQLAAGTGDDGTDVDVQGPGEGATAPAGPILLPSPSGSSEALAREVSATAAPGVARLSVWASPDGPSRDGNGTTGTATVVVAVVPERDGVEGTTPWEPADAVIGWNASTAAVDGAAVTVFSRGLTPEAHQGVLDGLTVTDGAATAPVPEGLEPLVVGRWAVSAAPSTMVPVAAGPALVSVLLDPADMEPSLTLVGGDPVLVDLALATADAGTGIVEVEVRGTRGWIVGSGPFDPGNAAPPTLVWEEGGRGWALDMTALAASVQDPDTGEIPPPMTQAVTELVAAAEALEVVTPQRWAEAVARWDAVARPTTGGSETVEGQGTPIDPATGEPVDGGAGATATTVGP